MGLEARKSTRGAASLTWVFALIISAVTYLGAQTETVLHSFAGAITDGNGPTGTLIQDANGNLYGTTHNGGVSNVGTVFKITPSGTETVLYSFCPSYPTCPDGEYPSGNLVLDGNGNLYGTTSNGGSSQGAGYGVVFEVAPDGAEKVLYIFIGIPDGAYPFAGLVMDSKGNLYGTAADGGADDWGTVFEITAAGTEKTLYSFTGGSDGGIPIAGLVMDGNGNLFGTTYSGGHPGCKYKQGCGVVFKVIPGGTESVLYSFTGGADGANPNGGVILGAQGNIYGTTSLGGSAKLGTVYELNTAGQETVLHTFTKGSDGAYPYGGVISDGQENLYGTTYKGGSKKHGTVFELSANETETILFSFTGKTGSNPYAGVIRDMQGNLYGTTAKGGAHKYGTVYRIAP
jgi:uncharacterized repeat protein (TIGR03803 family)